VPFVHVPNHATKRAEAEERMLGLLEGKADLVVLARYMQILSAGFVARFPNAMINIHHSFCRPSSGRTLTGRPTNRGVKIVGATAHYVTAQLDAVADHRAGRGPGHPRDMGGGPEAPRPRPGEARPGSRRALALRRPVIVHGNKTVVFS